MGVEVLVVRVMVVMAATVGGLGVAVVRARVGADPGAPRQRAGRRRPGAWREAALIVLAVAALFAGVHFAGSRVGEGLWPLVLGICGLALVWRPTVAAGGPAAGRRRRRCGSCCAGRARSTPRA